MPAEKEPKIYTAISNVMKDIGIVGKNASNDFDHYKYRSIDDVMNALNPAMTKNKVFVSPKIIDSKREERAGSKGNLMMYSVITVEYTFYTDDGSSVTATVIGEAMDRSDKSTNKAMAAAFKYACCQVFCIPTEDMEDNETESPELGKKVEKKDEPKNEANKENAETMTSSNKDSKKDLPKENELVTKEQLEKIKSEIERTGISLAQILDTAKVEKLEDMKQTTAYSILNKFARTKDKKTKDG